VIRGFKHPFGVQWDARCFTSTFPGVSQEHEQDNPVIVLVRHHPLRSPEHPSPQRLGGPWVKATHCWSTLEKENKEPCSKPYSLRQFCLLTSAPSFLFSPGTTTSQTSWKATYQLYPNPDCDCFFFAYSCSSMGFINYSVAGSLPCPNKPHVRRLTEKPWE